MRTDRSDAEEPVIPGKIVRFLEQHANLAFAGTRNRDRVPYGHRVSGWHVSGDARTLTALVSEHFTARLVESLEDNGEIALTVEEFPSHETYQFKGRYRRHRQLQDEDPAHFSSVEDLWVLTRFDDCLAAFSDSETWSSQRRGNLINDLPDRIGTDSLSTPM